MLYCEYCNAKIRRLPSVYPCFHARYKCDNCGASFIPSLLISNPNRILIIDGKYRFKCLYKDCPCNDNENQIYKTEYIDFPKELIHEWDGKNMIKCLCG